MAQVNADILRKNFGFNDPNVIQGILSDPGQVARYNREYEGILNPGKPQPSQPTQSALPSSTDFAQQQQQQTQGFMDALNQKLAGQESISSAAQRIGNDLELPALRKSAFELTQTLKKIPQNNLALSKQYGMSATSLQKRNAVQQQRQAPLAQEAVAQQQFAEAELGRRLGFLVADQQKELQPFYQAQLPLLQTRLAMEQSNYSLDKQAELSRILADIKQRGAATQAELNRANKLAIAEAGFQNSLDKIKLSTDEAIRKKQALQELGTGGTITSGNPSQYFTQGGNGLTYDNNWYLNGGQFYPTID